MDRKAPTTTALRPSWAKSLTDPAAFAHEQRQLAHVWTVLGVLTDLPNDGDWIRATLGGRSVFVQRFGDELRGFENRCAHRFYPLRTEDKGNGVIRCGFHHWQYNKDGLALGIPQCQELFGVTPRELNARLTRIEIATCGILIFGRFASAGALDTLEQYLGDGFPILQSFCTRTAAPYSTTRTIAANWKLCIHITLDDYHIVAVHPDSLGKRGYLSSATARYFQFGWHSAYMNGTTDDEAFAKMAAECRDGSYRPGLYYRILNIFPNTIASITRTLDRWYITIHQYVPLGVDRTLMRNWYFPAPYPPNDNGPFKNLLFGYIALWLPLIVRYYDGQLSKEDKEACETLQTIAGQTEGSPILGLQEKRIAWFEDAYAKAMATDIGGGAR